MTRRLMDLIGQYGDAREKGDTRAGELYGELRDALALAEDALPPADRLTERKTRDIFREKSYTLTGYVGRAADGRAVIISGSAVRWLDAPAFNLVMFPKPDFKPLPSSENQCHYPLCQSEAEQERIASAVHAELYTGEAAPQYRLAAYTSDWDISRIDEGRRVGSFWKNDVMRHESDIELYVRVKPSAVSSANPDEKV